MNPGKTKIIVFALSAILKEIKIHGEQLTKTKCTRFVSTTKIHGICIDQGLGFKEQVIAIKNIVLDYCEIS